jgi:CRISPR system Cascade subunit CasD
MTTLLMRLEGPMQSWGTRSRFSHRDTEREPSKSGVVGILCAALGRSRHEDVGDLASLEMAVRVDSSGRIETDFHTAQDVPRAGNPGRETVMSWRHYLADANFLVGLAGPRDALARLHGALRSPRWPLFLGRKSFVPSVPVFVPHGLVDDPLMAALARVEWPLDEPSLECVREVGNARDGDARYDVPVSFGLGERRFTTRYVRRETLTPARTKEEV